MLGYEDSVTSKFTNTKEEPWCKESSFPYVNLRNTSCKSYQNVILLLPKVSLINFYCIWKAYPFIQNYIV